MARDAIDLGTAIDQQLHDGTVAEIRGLVQRRVARDLGDRVDVRTLVQQQLGELEAVVAARNVQRRAFVFVGHNVGRRRHGEQQRRELGVALTHGNVQGRDAVVEQDVRQGLSRGDAALLKDLGHLLDVTGRADRVQLVPKRVIHRLERRWSSGCIAAAATTATVAACRTRSLGSRGSSDSRRTWRR